MKKMQYLLIVLLSVHYGFSQLSKAEVKGKYHLGSPERGKSEVIMDYGDMRGKTVIAIAACEKCPPAVYYYLKEESKTIGVPVFMSSGLYLFKYDKESFVLVQPDGLLGRKVWTKINYANVYSKNAKRAKSLSRAEIEKFTIALSAKIMNQETGEMTHASGVYHLAIPKKHGAKIQSSYQIEFITDGKKHIIIEPCDRCGKEKYDYLAKESAIAQVDIYRNASSHYLFDLKDGVLIYTFANASGLGKVLWGKNSHYNVYSNNKAYIRQILASKEKQDLIDNMMSGYFESIKTELERQAKEANKQKVANRKLPKEGRNNAEEKTKALKAAKRWATDWGWKEKIEIAYFSSNDWSITRNRLTGRITGKVIRGFVTMIHPDGRCRYQIVTFRQDFDGTNYMNFHMTGVGPVYDLKCGEI